MQQAIFSALLNNAALLVILSIIYELTNHFFPRPLVKQIANGILIAVACIAIMSLPFMLIPGIVFDTRSILISVTALIFGPITTTITVAAAAAFRLLQGGIGAIPGVVVILTSAIIGLVWRQRDAVKDRERMVLIILLTGNITMWVCSYALSHI